MTTHHGYLRSAALLVLAPVLALASLQPGPSVAAKKAKLPDLSVGSVATRVAEVAPGEVVTVSTTVTNVGKRASKPAKVRYYLSTDRATGKDTRLAASGKVRSLAPRKKATVRTRLVVPASAPDGNYFVLACVDGPGKDARKGNDCRASSARVTLRAPWKGTLTGKLTFHKEFRNPSANEFSRDGATVNVKINVDESKSGWAVFGNAGSTYSYEGTYDRSSADDWCATSITGRSNGFGAMSQVGDQYEDDIMGDFGALDRSEFDLLIGLRYDNTVTTTKSPVGNGCPASTVVDGPKKLRNLTNIEFHQGARVGKTIMYEIDHVLDPYGTKTTWQSVTGKLILQLK